MIKEEIPSLLEEMTMADIKVIKAGKEEIIEYNTFTQTEELERHLSIKKTKLLLPIIEECSKTPTFLKYLNHITRNRHHRINKIFITENNLVRNIHQIITNTHNREIKYEDLSQYAKERISVFAEIQKRQTQFFLDDLEIPEEDENDKIIRFYENSYPYKLNGEQTKIIMVLLLLYNSKLIIPKDYSMQNINKLTTFINQTFDILKFPRISSLTSVISNIRNTKDINMQMKELIKNIQNEKPPQEKPLKKG